VEDTDPASSRRVQLEDEDAFDMGAGGTDTEQAAAGLKDQATAPKKSSKKRKKPEKAGIADADLNTAAATDGEAMPPKKKKRKVRKGQSSFLIAFKFAG
jgi:hypothetical protein